MPRRFDKLREASSLVTIKAKRNWHDCKYHGRKKHDRRGYWLSQFKHAWKKYLKRQGNKYIRHCVDIPNGNIYRKIYPLDNLWY